MITGTEPVYEDTVPAEFKLSNEELEDWHGQIDNIAVEDEVLSVIQIIRAKIEEHNRQQEDGLKQIRVYDRRWKKIIRLLRTSAFLNERSKVDLMDCFLMTHCLWNQPQQFETVQQIVSETIRKHGYSVSIGLNMLKREVEEFRQEVDAEVKIKNTVTEEVLRPIEEEYYALRKNGEQFAGQYIQVKDYNKLKVDDLDVVNLYDDDFKLVNRLGAEKADAEFTLRVKHNSQVHRLHLQTYQREKNQYLFKKPHPLVKEFWDERYEKLAAYLKQQKQRVKDERPPEIDSGRGNIFIDEKLLPLVEANHQEVLDSLNQLELKLDKLRHLYENVAE
jgi:MoxR-like ATPase